MRHIVSKLFYTILICVLLIVAIVLPLTLVNKNKKRPPIYMMERSDFIADNYSYLNDYFTLNEFNRYMRYFAHPHYEYFDMRSIATTQKGNPIYMLNSVVNNDINKGAILVLSGISGNDWRSVSVALHYINMLIQNMVFRKRNPHTSKFQYYVVPLLNPDGYNYSRMSPMTRRGWMKNHYRHRMCVNHSVVAGTNIFYNTDFHFEKDTEKRSQFYAGKKAFSEPETQAVRTLITQLKKRLRYIFILISPQTAKNRKKSFLTFPHTDRKKLMFLRSIKLDQATRFMSKFNDLDSVKDDEVWKGRLDKWIATYTKRRARTYVVNIQTDYRDHPIESTKLSLKDIVDRVYWILRKYEQVAKD